jgi:catechol 2,3-dioxygenase
MNHFGWEMENEVELIAAYRRACEANVKIHRVSDHTLSRSIYLFDPDGNLHEIYSDSVADWRALYSSPRPLSGYTTGWMPDEKTASAARNYDPGPEIRRVPLAIFHSIRLERATVITRNFSRMHKFFVNVVGLSPVHESSNPDTAYLAGQVGKIDFVLMASASDASPGVHHCSFEVRDEEDLAESERRYKEQKGAVELSLSLATKRSVFVRDPDGLRIEFFAPRAAGFCDMNTIEARIRPYVT